MAHSKSTQSGVPWRRLRRGTLCLLTGLLVPTIVFAAVAMQAKSPLYWVFSAETLIVTVAEVGDVVEPSEVRVEVRDASNILRGSAHQRLTPEAPVHVSVAVPAGLAVQLRTIVTVTVPSEPALHQPIVSLEVYNRKTGAIRTLPPCAIPIEQMPSSGGGAEGNCGGWTLTPITTLGR